MRYIGRFAPSPTGPLHAGSLVAALASWLDARARGGIWLVRMEDADRPRCKPVFAAQILRQLRACGLNSDHPVVYQSTRSHLYQAALGILIAKGLAYPCSCSRKSIITALQQQGKTPARGQELVYPGFCASGLCSPHAQQLAWRLRTKGSLRQTAGDFVLKRADGCFAYQLAVVTDDACQEITHVVRGADLLDNTPRQIYLQQCLGYTTPEYLHTPLVLGSNGEKFSKQNQAKALQPKDALADLQTAAQTLGLPLPNPAHDINAALMFWIQHWAQQRKRYRYSNTRSSVG